MTTNHSLVATNVNTLDYGSYEMGYDHWQRRWKPLPISNYPKRYNKCKYSWDLLTTTDICGRKAHIFLRRWQSSQHVTGASVHVPRQRNSTYVQTVIRSIYETRRPEHPHLPIHRYKWRPPETPFTALLHGILPGHVPTLRYGYGYVYSLSRSPRALHRYVKSPSIVASGTRC